MISCDPVSGSSPRLWAISDLHAGHHDNKHIIDSLVPTHPADWLIIAGDVAERSDDIITVLDILRHRFDTVIWTPGNHELWTTVKDPVQLKGQDRYDYLIDACDARGIITPEHPFVTWTNAGGPATIIPMFIGYDYTFLPPGTTTSAEGLAAARHAHVIATDEFLLFPDPWPTRQDWCHARLMLTQARLEELDWLTPTILVNHFPTVFTPCEVLIHQEFCLWCGTQATTDWHRRYNALCCVYGHLHIPRTTYYDTVRFEEVSVGYPREWKRRRPHRWLRQILPPPTYPPGYLNEFGGHFRITDALRAEITAAQQVRKTS